MAIAVLGKVWELLTELLTDTHSSQEGNNMRAIADLTCVSQLPHQKLIQFFFLGGEYQLHVAPHVGLSFKEWFLAEFDSFRGFNLTNSNVWSNLQILL